MGKDCQMEPKPKFLLGNPAPSVFPGEQSEQQLFTSALPLLGS